MQFNAFVIAKDGLHFEIDADRRDESGCETIVCVSKQETGFPDTRITDNQQFEHVIEVLIGSILLPFRVTTASHLKEKCDEIPIISKMLRNSLAILKQFV